MGRAHLPLSSDCQQPECTQKQLFLQADLDTSSASDRYLEINSRINGLWCQYAFLKDSVSWHEKQYKGISHQFDCYRNLLPKKKQT